MSSVPTSQHCHSDGRYSVQSVQFNIVLRLTKIFKLSELVNYNSSSTIASPYTFIICANFILRHLSYFVTKLNHNNNILNRYSKDTLNILLASSDMKDIVLTPQNKSIDRSNWKKSLTLLEIFAQSPHFNSQASQNYLAEFSNGTTIRYLTKEPFFKSGYCRLLFFPRTLLFLE